MYLLRYLLVGKQSLRVARLQPKLSPFFRSLSVESEGLVEANKISIGCVCLNAGHGHGRGHGHGYGFG